MRTTLGQSLWPITEAGCFRKVAVDKCCFKEVENNVLLFLGPGRLAALGKHNSQAVPSVHLSQIYTLNELYEHENEKMACSCFKEVQNNVLLLYGQGGWQRLHSSSVYWMKELSCHDNSRKP